MIELDYQDQVAIVTLSRGVTNAMNPALVGELAATLARVRDDPAASAMVLASANDKFFSIGLDIPELIGFSRDQFRSFFRACSQMWLALYTLPKPTVAAITGHAIAGGTILALCCDYRFVAEGRRLMGLNEIKLGLPVPHLADCILRSVAGYGIARDMMDSGEFYLPEALAQCGVVDGVLPATEVVVRATEKARSLGAMPAEAYAAIKSSRVEAIQAEVVARWEEKERVFVDCWFSAEAQTRLREAMAKF